MLTQHRVGMMQYAHTNIRMSLQVTRRIQECDLVLMSSFFSVGILKCVLLVSDRCCKSVHTSHLLNGCGIQAVQSLVYTGDFH